MLPKKDYTLEGFTKSKLKNKKYTAHLKNKKTGKTKIIHFGAIKNDGTPYQQYRDIIGLYSDYNHFDPERRRRYIIRHEHNSYKPYSANYFSRYYLW